MMQKPSTSLPILGAAPALLAALLLSACAVQPPAPAAEPAPPAEIVEVPPAPEPAPTLPTAPEPEAAGEVAVVAPPPAPVWKRDDVLWIQERLQELGYYEGAVDGAVGPGTRQAIRDYQQDQDVKADGQPTAALREFMWRNGG